jgi:hypothetical protein
VDAFGSRSCFSILKSVLSNLQAGEVDVMLQRVSPGLLALILTACGGGGGGRADFDGSSYLVSGFDRSGREVRVCIDGIDPPDPNSPAGRDTTASLLEYYGLGGPAQVYLSVELSCLELDPTVDEVVTVEEYNSIIVPSTGRSAPPAIGMERRAKPLDATSGVDKDDPLEMRA